MLFYMSVLPQEKYYTYEEWSKLEWNPEVRAELINGQIVMMAAPATRHQIVEGEIFTEFNIYLRGKKCRVFSGLGVKIGKDTELIPDIVVICDPDKITERGCDGAPNLVIEILSPSSRKRDKLTKFDIYLKTGVPEYWIVDPGDKTVTTHRLLENVYTTAYFGEEDKIPVSCLPGFELDLSLVFQSIEAEFKEETF